MRHGIDIGGRRRLGRRLALLPLLLLFAACSLEVNDLPENHLPEVGEILIDPPTSELAPLDSFRLSISAEDPDGDPLRFTWAKNLGSWSDDVMTDSIVTWVAPASFFDDDSVKLSVTVRDLDEAEPVKRLLHFPIVNRQGDLRVQVRDLAGDPVAVPLAVVGVETTTVAVSDHLFTDLPWGEQQVLSFATPWHHGAVDEVGGFVGYPDTVFIEPDEEIQLQITVAPTSLLLVPGLHDGQPITEIQAGIDLCAQEGIDSLLLRAGEYDLPNQPLDGGGSAALILDEADLVLAAFPGEEPIRLDIDQGANDFGLYLAGRGTATRVTGLALRGAASSGVYLYQSGGHLDGLLMEHCGATGVFLSGDAADTLRMTACVSRGNDHGVSLSGGVLDGEGLLLEDSGWYGLWLRDGAAGTLRGGSIVNSELSAIFLAGGAMSIERTIMARNGRGIFRQSGPLPELICNLLWANEYGDYGDGLVAGPSDLAADPLFCDPELGDWRVQAESPALSAGCGPIGAFEDCDSDGGPYLPDPEVN